MNYRLRAVRREPDGIVSPPLHERILTAGSAGEAIRLARAVDIDMDAIGANAIFLVDEAGTILWSLRRQDVGE